MLATYGSRTGGVPVLLGSLKSNIGHAQAAAGVGGVIKMVQAMRAGVAPRSLHCEVPSPMVDWDSGAVRLLSSRQDWPDTGRPRRAAVSSFGIGGTNAHVILEEPPAVEAEPAADEPTASGTGLPVPLVVSAATPQALRANLDQLADHPVGQPADLARSLLTGRALLAHRAVAVAADRNTLTTALRTATLVTPPRPGRTAVLFTGQGSQWVGMGEGLVGVFP
ncbi:ketoacyl-synthetase C-terminal extension domain-containing protein, partial [Micromonospora gifhornensis]|uniref:ketoacyl-synthetase C-terminal extension domain-containing protein n=2 Tax=Micromonospora gifhornensis TaxID=84594 RepID=UPI0031DFC9DB